MRFKKQNVETKWGFSDSPWIVTVKVFPVNLRSEEMDICKKLAKVMRTVMVLTLCKLRSEFYLKFPPGMERKFAVIRSLSATQLWPKAGSVGECNVILFDCLTLNDWKIFIFLLCPGDHLYNVHFGTKILFIILVLQVSYI